MEVKLDVIKRSEQGETQMNIGRLLGLIDKAMHVVTALFTLLPVFSY